MEESDLTVLDPWGIVARANESCGQNLVFAWTEAGLELLKACSKAIAIQSVSASKAAVPFDYNAIKRKESKAQRYARFGLFSLEILSDKAKSWIGEAILKIFPHSSSFYSILQKIRRVPRG
jgi:hypothetical protein